MLQRAMISGALVIIWPAVLIRLGPVFPLAWAVGMWERWRADWRKSPPREEP